MIWADEVRERDRAQLQKAFPGWLLEDRQPSEVPVPAFMICCDLHKGRDRAFLEGAIHRLGDIMRCLDSVWLLASECSAAEIRNYVSDYLADGEKMFIVACESVSSSSGFDSSASTA